MLNFELRAIVMAIINCCNPRLSWLSYVISLFKIQINLGTFKSAVSGGDGTRRGSSEPGVYLKMFRTLT